MPKPGPARCSRSCANSSCPLKATLDSGRPTTLSAYCEDVAKLRTERRSGRAIARNSGFRLARCSSSLARGRRRRPFTGIRHVTRSKMAIQRDFSLVRWPSFKCPSISLMRSTFAADFPPSKEDSSQVSTSCFCEFFTHNASPERHDLTVVALAGALSRIDVVTHSCSHSRHIIGRDRHADSSAAH